LLRYGVKVLQIVLAMCGLYLLYATISPFIQTWEVAEISVPDVAPRPKSGIAFAAYAPIGARNLFNSQKDAPDLDALALEEELEESKLQLKLLGTIAGNDAYSVATLEDEKTRDHLHVRVNDLIGDTGDIHVARIERKRIVINNGGNLEALTMDEETATRPAAKATRSSRSRKTTRVTTSARNRPAASRASRADRSKLLDRVRNLPGNQRKRARASRRSTNSQTRPEPDFRGNSQAAQTLLEQVRLKPSFTQDGAFEGMLIDEVFPGTALASAGLQEGDIVVGINEVNVTGPKDLNKAQAALTESGENCLEVLGADGTRQTRCWENQ
jgi:type II secretion system protein C